MHNFNLEPPLKPVVHTAWEFSHPIPPTVLAQASLRRGGSAVGGGGGFVGGDGANEHNYRECTISFPIQEQGVCHGLGGYFETVLYSGSEGPVELSTNPVTMEQKSKDMISWFPIFFPLKVSKHSATNLSRDANYS
jgi:type II protein arginine methyltransferase